MLPKDTVVHKTNWWIKLIIWGTIGWFIAIHYLSLHISPSGHGYLTFEFFRHHFLKVAEYFLTCLGSPLSEEPHAAFASGMLLIIIFLSAILSIRQNTATQRFAAIAPSMLFLFSVLFVCLIVRSRVGGGLDAALSSRYCTFTSLGILGIYLLLLSQRNLNSSYHSMQLGLLLGIIALGTISTYKSGTMEGQIVRENRIILANMVRFPQLQADAVFAQQFPASVPPRESIAYLKQNHLSLFANLSPPLLGELKRTVVAPCFLLENINTLPVHTYPLQRHVIIDSNKEPSVDFRGWAISFSVKNSLCQCFHQHRQQPQYPNWFWNSQTRNC